MILVDRGYTLTEHAPTTYNYQYQNVPSAITRTIGSPVSQFSPPMVLTTTGYPLYLTAQAMAADTFEGTTEADCYISSHSTAGRGIHEVYRNVWDESEQKYRLREDADGTSALHNKWSVVPIKFAFIADTIRNSGGIGMPNFEYYTRNAKVMYQYTDFGKTRVEVMRLYFDYYDTYNSIDIAQTGSFTQQDYLYTVTGGVVT